MVFDPLLAAREPRWLSDEARQHIRDVLKPRLPHWQSGPREFQLDAWLRTLAGVSQLLVVPTGGGKTALFFGPILVVQELKKQSFQSANLPVRELPKNPMVLVVTPLNALGDMQAAEMRELNIKAVSVNADTIRQAWNEKRDLLDEIRRGQWSVTIWSPEKLTARGTNDILTDQSFRANVLCIAIDEAHVVNQWGRDFRQAYQNIGAVRKRVGMDVPIVAATATLIEGPERQFVCTNLGLEAGTFHFERHSCERPNVRMVVHELTHTLTGSLFPDILWVLDEHEHVVVYCKSIDLLFRVALYLWRSLPPGPDRLDIVRVWDSLTSSRYNTRTLELWSARKARVIVATVAFGLGINRADILTVVNLGTPESLSLDLQQRGRAGRDLMSAAVGITYVEPSVMKKVMAKVKAENAGPSELQGEAEKGRKVKKRTQVASGDNHAEESIEPNMMAILTAHVTGACLCVAVNHVYQNPGVGSLSPCVLTAVDSATTSTLVTFTRRLPCSSCQPFWEATIRPRPFCSPPGFVSPAATPALPILSITEKTSKTRVRMIGPQLPPPLTKKMRENALYRLNKFARQRWILKDGAAFRYIPHLAFWEDDTQKRLLDVFHLIRDEETLNISLQDWKYLSTDGPALCLLVCELNARYDDLVAKLKANRTQKAAEARAEKAAAKRAPIVKLELDDKENTPATDAIPPSLSAPLVFESAVLPVFSPNEKGYRPAPMSPRATLFAPSDTSSNNVPMSLWQHSRAAEELEPVPPHLIVPSQAHLIRLKIARKRARSNGSDISSTLPPDDNIKRHCQGSEVNQPFEGSHLPQTLA